MSSPTLTHAAPPRGGIPPTIPSTTLLVLALAAGLAAQEPQPSPSPLKPEFMKPSPPAVDAAPRPAPGTVTPSTSRESADAGALRGVVALSLRQGEARLRMADGSERVVRPGDAVGNDVVKRVSPERIVLTRSAGGSASGLVVVTFDRRGRSLVRVYAESPGALR